LDSPFSDKSPIQGERGKKRERVYKKNELAGLKETGHADPHVQKKKAKSSSSPGREGKEIK